MNDDNPRFSDQLLAAERLSPDSRQQLQKELNSMFVRELTTPRRIVFVVVAVAALAGAAVCGFLAITEPDLPTLPRVGLGTGTLFGVAWAVVAARLARRGSIDLVRDNRRMAAMVWVFTMLMVVFFLIVGMSIEDRLLGLMMIANGLAFLIGAAVYWLNYRIEEAELSTRQKLLQLELQVAQLSQRN